eukprot:1677475-Alexandrium_andersonii.AAC.1
MSSNKLHMCCLDKALFTGGLHQGLLPLLPAAPLLGSRPGHPVSRPALLRRLRSSAASGRPH